VRWHRRHLARWSADAMDDPRVEVVTADLGDWLRSAADRYDAICLDVDNGPEWTVTVDNEALYGKAGLDALARRLVPDGTLAVWSSNAAAGFEALLWSRFATVHTRLLSVARGEPDVVYVARRPR
jgi:spermidine synthase